MQALVEPFRRIFDFSGRTARKPFWIYIACMFGVSLVASILRDAILDPTLRAGVIAIGGAVSLPLPSIFVRRLHDTGRSGAWAFFALIPWIGGLIVLALCLFKSAGETRDWPKRPAHLAGSAVVVLLAALIVSRFFWAPYWIVSDSMKPTLVTGDYVIASLRPGTPRRGDVIVFRDSIAGFEFIFRVAALPGDTIAMRDGVPILNGEPVPQIPDGDFVEPFDLSARGTAPLCREPAPAPGDPCTNARFIETLPDSRTPHTILDTRATRLDNTGEITVPADHVFVLGDHRDNASDSRLSAPMGRGLVPIENITGRASRILFSSSDLRPDRLFSKVR